MSVIVTEILRPRQAWRLVAEVEGVPAAILSLECSGPVASLRALQTLPGFERLGLANDLMTAALELARRVGAISVQASCGPGDRATKNLLEQAGFRTIELTLARSLLTNPD